MDPAWIPVISGFVGAGGAIAAQAVSAYFTGRREAANRRALAFRDEKRDLFMRVLVELDEFHRDRIRAIQMFTESFPYKREPTRAEMTRRWYALTTECFVIAPEAEDAMDAAGKTIEQLDLALEGKETESDPSGLEYQLRMYRRMLGLTMHRSLGVKLEK